MDFNSIPMQPIAFDRAPEGLHATHQGVFEIAGATFRVYQLSDGQRVIDAEDLAAFLSPLMAR